jgi:glycosidase
MNMKTPFVSLFAFILFINLHAQVDRVEPPNWWAGMHHPALQLMVHGNNIGGSSVKIDYEGVNIASVSTLDNPNYLFITLELSTHIRPGVFEVELEKCGQPAISFHYELYERAPASARREGFNNSDVICLVMPDRFANGNPGNDVVEGMREGIVNRNDPTGRHGGDLKGIRDHLDYFADMGFTALWLNPVLENDMERTSYHGYSITDFYRVDPRLGSNEEFRALTAEAGEKGIKMIMDMVFNHIGLYHWWMEDLPSSDWINYYPEYVRTNHRRTVNQDPYASEADRKRMVSGWFDSTMPDLNQGNPFLANYLIQNSIWWIEYAGLSGIRMDTYPYCKKEMMAEWNRRVLAEYPGFNIVGEEWSLDPGLVSYWQKGQVNRDGYRGSLPSLMDFPLQAALTGSLLAEDGWDSGWLMLYETLASDHLYPDPYNLVIFPDNHDMSRFYMQLGMDADLYRLGIIYILTTRGIPQILYGSEIPMTHTESNHHGDIRKDFPGGWSGDPVNAFTGDGLSEAQLEMQDFFRQLLHWRRENPVIHTGELIHYAPQGGSYVFGRYNDENRVMVLLNKSGQQIILDTERFKELIGTFIGGTDVLTGQRYHITEPLEVPAVTGLILELE